MRRIWLIIAISSLLCSCSNDNHYAKYKKRYTSNYKSNHSYSSKQKTAQREFIKYSDRIKPSESMTVGIAKSDPSFAFDDENDDRPEDADSLRIANEDGERLLDEEGNYKGYFKVGNPYEVFGVSYVPQNYEDYEEVGTASWYGDDFHGKLTANGEIYDMQSLTAAHPTLPLPSLVRVTNLRNNKSVIVRVNDRGPFSKSRIIDVSERAADILEFKNQGTTEVKIELLRNDTDEMLQRLKIRN